MGDEGPPDPGDDPQVQRNRIRLGLIGGPLTALLAAGLWAIGLRAVGVVLAALAVATVGAAVDAVARRAPIAGTPTHVRVLYALAFLAVVIGLAPLAVAGDLLDGDRRGAAVLVLGPIAGAGVAWWLVQRARRLRRPDG